MNVFHCHVIDNLTLASRQMTSKHFPISLLDHLVNGRHPVHFLIIPSSPTNQSRCSRTLAFVFVFLHPPAAERSTAIAAAASRLIIASLTIVFVPCYKTWRLSPEAAIIIRYPYCHASSIAVTSTSILSPLLQ